MKRNSFRCRGILPQWVLKMPLFGKSKSKNPPPPPPKPDYTPQNVDPDDNPLYQPPELLQSYLEPPVTQSSSVRHSASDLHSNPTPVPTQPLKTSESCSFIQNNLSYEVDGDLVKHLQNSSFNATPAPNGRPRFVRCLSLMTKYFLLFSDCVQCVDCVMLHVFFFISIKFISTPSLKFGKF